MLQKSLAHQGFLESTGNAVRMQVSVGIITYCTITII